MFVFLLVTIILDFFFALEYTQSLCAFIENHYDPTIMKGSATADPLVLLSIGFDHIGFAIGQYHFDHLDRDLITLTIAHFHHIPAFEHPFWWIQGIDVFVSKFVSGKDEIMITDINDVLFLGYEQLHRTGNDQ